MVVGIHQLHYLPWLRYFEKIAHSGVFVVLDDIQFTKNDWQNRNKVKAAGGPVLLTVPVHAEAGQRLDEVRIDNGVKWRKKHWRTLEQSYGKAPYFADHAPFLEDTYRREWERLNDLNRHLLAYFVDALGIETPIRYSSEMAAPGRATERLVNLIEAVGGDAYYTGAHAAAEYLDVALFERAGIRLDVQVWSAPVYPQLHGRFASDLAIVDLLMNCGPGSLPILARGTERA